MFARHLPPSAGQPVVLALDDASAAEMPAGADVRALADEGTTVGPGKADAVAGFAPPDRVEAAAGFLRPGGRLILAEPLGEDAAVQSERLLAALADAGLIHCLVEPSGDYLLYRGERPPEGSPVERLQTLGTQPPPTAFVFVLVTQTPNKPAWTLAPGEPVTWRAHSRVDPADGRARLLAFSSLVRAVAFMQAAVLAGKIAGVNKVGKYPAEQARAWALPLMLNPDFEVVRDWAPGPAYEVDPAAAVTGEE